MIYVENVRGTQDKVLQVEVTPTCAYIRDNIHRVEDEEGNELWEYNEKQMTLDEYYREAVPALQQAITELSIILGGMQ